MRMPCTINSTEDRPEDWEPTSLRWVQATVRSLEKKIKSSSTRVLNGYHNLMKICDLVQQWLVRNSVILKNPWSRGYTYAWNANAEQENTQVMNVPKTQDPWPCCSDMRRNVRLRCMMVVVVTKKSCWMQLSLHPGFPVTTTAVLLPLLRTSCSSSRSHVTFSCNL